MPVSYRLPARLVGSGLLCAFIAAAVYGKVLEAQRNRPYGRFTESQILERAHAVSSALITRNGILHADVHRSARQHRDGKYYPLWFVDYTNEENDSILRLGFDGETGALDFAGVFPPKAASPLVRFARPGTLDAASTVLKLSRDWVYTLGLAPKMGPWEVTHNPQQRGNLWRVAWQCRDHTLDFSFERITGRLIMAQMHA